MSIINKLKKISQNTNDTSYSSICLFLLKNISNIGKYDIKTVAQESNVSISTVTRFSKWMGFEGFKEFKESLKLEYKQEKLIPINNDIELQTFISALEKNLVFLKNNYHFYQMAFQKICGAKKIYLYGFGGNSYLIKLFRNYLIRVGLSPIYLHDKEDQLAYSKLPTQNSLSIIVSYKFRHEYWSQIIRNIRKNNGEIIFITKDGFNKLIDKSDLLLTFPYSEGYLLERDNAEISMLTILIMIVEQILLNKSNADMLKMQDVD